MRTQNILNLILLGVVTVVLFACGAGSDTNDASTGMSITQTNCNSMSTSGNSCEITLTYSTNTTTTLTISPPSSPYNTSASSQLCNSYIGSSSQVNGTGSCTYTITCSNCTHGQTPNGVLGVTFNGVSYNSQTTISY